MKIIEKTNWNIKFISLTLISFIIIYILIINFSSKNFDEISSQYKKTLFIENNKIIDSLYNKEILINSEIDEIHLNRIINQLEIIRSRYEAHDKMLNFLYSNFYFFIFAQAIVTFITIFLGLYVSKEGWEKIDKKYIFLLLFLTGFFIFLKMVPDSMKFEENINNNKFYYLSYKKIENDIFTYISTKQINGNYKNSDKFIYYIDEKIKNNITISFEIQEAPADRYRKELNL